MKIVITAVLVIAAALLILVILCAMVVAGRSDEQARKMYWKNQICPKCKVGKRSYELDKSSEMCPYIECWKDGKCPYFKPIRKPENKGISKDNIISGAFTPPRKMSLVRDYGGVDDGIAICARTAAG